MASLSNLRERIRALRRRIQQLTDAKDRLERQIEDAVDLLNHYVAVWEAEFERLQDPELADEVTPEDPWPEPMIQTPLTRRGPNPSMFQMVAEVLAEGREPLHLRDITERVRELYPDAAQRSADLERQVGVALVRGTQRGMFQRTQPNTFRISEGAEST